MGNSLKKIALSLVLTSVVTACSTPEEDTASTPTPEAITTSISTQPAADQSTTSTPENQCPTAEQVDTSSPDSLAEGFIPVAFCWDSVHDQTMTAAAIRAKPLMTDRLAELQVEPKRNSSQALFNEAYEHQAYAVTTAQKTPSEVNSFETEEKASRVFRVNWDWAGRDGTTTSGGSYLLTLNMTKDQKQQWKVDDYFIADFAETRS